MATLQNNAKTIHLHTDNVEATDVTTESKHGTLAVDSVNVVVVVVVGGGGGDGDGGGCFIIGGDFNCHRFCSNVLALGIEV